MFHLFYVREIKANTHQIPLYLDRYLRTNKNVYPFIYHWILSFLSEKRLLQFERINGAFFDCLNALIILLFCLYLNNYHLIMFSSFQLFQIFFLFLFFPLFTRLGSGPRAYNGSPRIFGQTLYLVHILTFYIYLHTSSWLAFTLSVISVGIASMSSIFSMQVILFIGLALTFFYPIYLGVIIISFVIFYLLTFGRNLVVINGAFKHSHNYATKQFTYLYPQYKNIKQVLYDLYAFVYDIKNKKRTIRQFVRMCLTNNHYIYLLLFILPLVFLVGFYLVVNFDTVGFFVVKPFAIIFMASLILFFATKHKPLLFLGEGERYIEYCVFSIIILFVIYTPEQHHWLFIFFDFYFFLLSIYFSIKYISQFKHLNKNPEVGNSNVMFDINNLTDGLVMPIPNYHGKAVLFHTNQTKVMVPYLMFDEKYFTSEWYYEIFGNNFEYPNGDLKTLINKYHVKYIITTKGELELYINRYLNKDINFYDLFEYHSSDELYNLYKLKLDDSKR